jgi:hypothetical protein
VRVAVALGMRLDHNRRHDAYHDAEGNEISEEEFYRQYG